MSGGKGRRRREGLYPTGGIHGKIVHALGQRIGHGEMLPGERLPSEADLIEEFSASRTALREAFKVLSSKGLIEARQRAGTRVAERSHWDLLDPDVLSWLTPENLDDQLIADMVELREVIEPMAAQLAAARANSEDIRDISEAYERMVAEGENADGYFDADLDFHLAVLAACHNQLLTRLSGVVATVLHLSFRLQYDTYEPGQGTAEHADVLHAIERGDKAAAGRAMRKTIKSGEENIRLLRRIAKKRG